MSDTSLEEFELPCAATALLLPGYSPDLAWMACALNAGRVILDDRHPFSRKSRVHRTKIRTPDGHQWLTIPFVSADRRKPISEVRIDERRPWLKHHWQALEFNYRNSLYFDFYEPEIRADLETAAESEFLLDAVRHLMKRQWTYLELPWYPEWKSEHDSETHIADPCSDNDTTCSGDSKRDRERSDSTESGNTETEGSESGRAKTEYTKTGNPVVWQEPNSRNYQKPHPDAVQPVFHIPEYRQHFPGFVPGCGLLDLLFEYGPDAWQVLDELSSGEPGKSV